MVVGELIQEKELIVIGGGPGGYTAAIRAAQLGQKVTLIEKDELGGICLNKGCIPSKVYTHAANEMATIPHLSELGMKVEKPSIHLSDLISYKNKITDQLKNGVAALCKANKIEVIKGEANFLSKDRLGVEAGHDFQTFRFKKVIIAAGGTRVAPETVKLDGGKRVLVSHDIFTVEEVPEHLTVLGGDVIALEMAMTFNAFGSKVTVVTEETESEPFDAAVMKELHRIFKKKKITLQANCKLASVTPSEDKVTVQFIDKKGEEQTIECSHLYTSGNIQVNTESLGIDRLQMKMTADGFVEIDDQMQTSVENMYAVGDITPGPWLAVKAIKQAKAAAEIITGQSSEADLTLMPVIAHTQPPIAAAGLTEAEAEEYGYAFKTSQFALTGNGYASILGKKEGFVKVIAEEGTDLILGVHIIGAGAIEMSSTLTVGMEMTARAEDFTFPHYAHPSVNEALLEAIEGLVGQAIHMAPPKK